MSKLNSASQIVLNRFQPREYQLPICDALENKGYKRIICIMPRRAGKDVVAWNLMIRAALRRIGAYFYVFPTYSQAKKVIWDSSTIDGHRFINYYIPEQIVEQMNGQEMKIRLTNGSLIQLVGSDNVDSLMGTNPLGVVFSEYALQSPQAYQFLRPILMANNGWAMFLGTPRGKNHFYYLYQIALQNKNEWFAYHLTLEDTRHIADEEMEKMRAAGDMSEDLIQQEFYCSFERGIETTVYGKYMDRIRLLGQVGHVPYEPGIKVHTAWDLGMSDTMVILFWQNVGQNIHVIDCYEGFGNGMDHYARVLQEKKYVYGKHIAPHDIQVREIGTGLSRLESAHRLGIKFTLTSNVGLADGIESVRRLFNKLWLDDSNKRFIKALDHYRYKYDEARDISSQTPIHDWTSHYTDALRYLALGYPKTKEIGASPEDLDRRYREAMYGNQAHLPAVFRDDLPPY